jgi:glyoxylase-like metal-dependent hydrolase (beta-lactamase superfamily II)
MDTHKITDHITLINGKNKGRFPFSHSILIEDDITALIDTGCGIDTLNQLKTDVDLVINSHSHPDHTAGNWVFTSTPLMVPHEERAFNSKSTALSERYAGKWAAVWRDFIFKTMHFRDAEPTHTFCNKDIIACGETALEAVHTPGHTVGHYCFFEHKNNILFSFDIDFTTFGPWYGHEESDIEQFKASVEGVKALNPEIVVSSHKGVITEDIAGEFERFVQVFQERDQRILIFLDKERTLKEIVDNALIYRDFSFHPVLLRYWEEMMVQKHLEGLIETGRVIKREKKFLAT